jgi:hypothetical protein
VLLLPVNAAMASLQALFGTAFDVIAEGSQNDPITVTIATTAITAALKLPEAQQQAQLRHHLRDLLQAAGWLVPCFLPSSPLPTNIQLVAVTAWVNCVEKAFALVRAHPPSDEAEFFRLMEPRTSPRVPGMAHTKGCGMHVWSACTCVYTLPWLAICMDVHRLSSVTDAVTVATEMAGHYGPVGASRHSCRHCLLLWPALVHLCACLRADPCPLDGCCMQVWKRGWTLWQKRWPLGGCGH